MSTAAAAYRSTTSRTRRTTSDTLWAGYPTGKNVPSSHVNPIYVYLFRPLRSKEEESRFMFGSVSDIGEDKKIQDWGESSRRRRYLQYQFPLHDIDTQHCHDMTFSERQL